MFARGRIGDDRPGRYRQDHIFTLGTVLVVTTTGLPVRSTAHRLAMVFHQRIEVVGHAEDHGSSIASVASIWAAEGLELLAVHRGAAVTAVTCLHGQFHAIDE